ncbi:hypothetical protein AD998_06835 [bacterium 336/3]|nr:hypothetical protein AD998_06835 [bacterium 336/3]
MTRFKKIDLPIQVILLLICWLPLAISPWFIIYWMITMPILGLWQIISVSMYAYNKQLTSLHKIYLVVLMIAVITSIIIAFFSAETLMQAGVVLGFSMALFYMFVSYKTLKTTPQQA